MLCNILVGEHTFCTTFSSFFFFARGILPIGKLMKNKFAKDNNICLLQMMYILLMIYLILVKS